MSKIISGVIVVLLLVLGGLIAADMNKAAPVVNVEPVVLAGADDVGKYTHISSTNASSTAGTVVRGGPGVLNSVTINTTSGQIVKLYDGASSATSSATLIASIKANAAEQTFVYNIAVSKGLVIEAPASYAGSITISHR